VTSALGEGPFTVRVLLGESFRLLPRNPRGFALLLGVELVGALVGQLIKNPEEYGFLLRVSASCFSAIGTAAFLSWTHAELLQEPGRSPLSALHVGLLRFPGRAVMQLLFGIIVGVGALFLLLPGLYFAVRMSLAPPLLVLAGRGPVQALDDAHSLTQEHWKPLLGVFAVMFALAFGCSFALGWVLSFLAGVIRVVWPMSKGLNVIAIGGTEAVTSALLYTPILIAWMRLSRSVPSST
jgi:hypothetical protein